MSEKKFKIGDLVRLKKGSPARRIAGINDNSGNVIWTWFSEKELITAEIKIEELCFADTALRFNFPIRPNILAVDFTIKQKEEFIMSFLDEMYGHYLSTHEPDIIWEVCCGDKPEISLLPSLLLIMEKEKLIEIVKDSGRGTFNLVRMTNKSREIIRESHRAPLKK